MIRLKCRICGERDTAEFWLTQCGHEFCAECTQKLNDKPQPCPACRRDVKSHRPFIRIFGNDDGPESLDTSGSQYEFPNEWKERHGVSPQQSRQVWDLVQDCLGLILAVKNRDDTECQQDVEEIARRLERLHQSIETTVTIGTSNPTMSLALLQECISALSTSLRQRAMILLRDHLDQEDKIRAIHHNWQQEFERNTLLQQDTKLMREKIKELLKLNQALRNTSLNNEELRESAESAHRAMLKYKKHYHVHKKENESLKSLIHSHTATPVSSQSEEEDSLIIV